MRSSRRLGLHLCVSMLIAAPTTGWAQIREWQNLLGGSWSLNTNWSGNDVPDTAAETVLFSGATGYAVTLDLGNTTIGGIDWSNPNAVLNIVPGLSNSALSVNSDFTINGVLNLNSDNNFDVSLIRNGTITTSATGTLQFGGTSTNSLTLRQLSADLVNNGAVIINQDARSTRAGAVLTNNAAFTIAAGKNFTNTNVTTFNQNGGTLANNGTFEMSGDTFNFNGGTITGNNIDLSSSTLNITTANAGGFDFTGASFLSGDVGAAQTININPGSSNSSVTGLADFTNNGTINLNSDNNFDVSLIRAGTITNSATGTIQFGGASDDPLTLRQLNADLVNNGAVILNQSARSTRAGAMLTNNGTFTIAADKSFINTNLTTFNQNGGTLANNGTFEMSGDTFNFNGGTITGNNIQLSSSTLNIAHTAAAGFDVVGASTISGNVAADQVINLSPGSSSSSLTATADFTNHGTFNLDSDNAFDVSLIRAGTITNSATGTIQFGGTATGPATLRILNADLVNNGTVTVNQDARSTRAGAILTNNGTFTVAADKSFINTNLTTFNQNGGTLANNGTFELVGDTFNYNGGSITGNSIEMDSSTLNIATTGAATFDITGSSTYSGDLAMGQTINLTPGSSSSSLTASADFENNGTINLNSDNSFDVTLIRAGTITNGADGTIQFGGSSDSIATLRSINADLINNGSIEINQNARSIRGGAVLTNNASFTVAADKSFTNTNLTTFNQDGGTLTNDGAFEMSGDTFNFNGGNITGNAIELSSSTLAIGAGSLGTGEFDVSGTSTLSGDIAAAQTVNLRPGSSSSSLTSAADYTNNGTINLDSDNSFDVTLTRAGTITNTGNINFGGTATGAGTIRRIHAEIDNQGTIDVVAQGTATAIGRVGADNLNSGDLISRNAASVVTFTGDTFTNQATGTLAGVGELDFTATDLSNLGTIAPGLSAGTLTLDGDVFFGSTSMVEIELGGTTPGSEYDVLVGLDLFDLDGGLNVSFINGFQSSILNSDTFTIIDAGTLTGTFAGLSNGTVFTTADGFGQFTINYTGTQVQLGNFQSISAVPEPGALAVSGLALTCMMFYRRRRSTRN